MIPARFHVQGKLDAWVGMKGDSTLRIEAMASCPRPQQAALGALAALVSRRLWLAAVAGALLDVCTTSCMHAHEVGAPGAPYDPNAVQAVAYAGPGGRGGPGSGGPEIVGTYDAPPARSEVQVGNATWYGAALAGRPTASGERFDPARLTAAHRTLPFGTWVEVTRLDNGLAVRVRITDRGPFGHADRIIDLSRAAAERVDLVHAGVARVQVRVVDGP